jgi:hypothetical protein
VSTSTYPWFQLVSSEELEQGDILEECPVYQPPDELAGGESLSPVFDFEDRDVIVMSQTCDLVVGREKVAEIVMCPVWQLSDYKDGFLATPKGREDVRRGNLPGYHMLAGCELPAAKRDVRIVDFRQILSLPTGYVRKRAGLAVQRLRLLPPYREHLAQAFARFFMRIGLPTDIPPFR